jgi:hypothetical protein
MNAPLSELMGAALSTPKTSRPAPGGPKCATCRGAFSGMSWDTFCPSCWEEKLRKDSAERRARASGNTRKPDFARAEQVVQDYVADYEMRGEDSLGQDASYIPTERERVLIVDAIHGLLAEPAFIVALAASQQQEG